MNNVSEAADRLRDPVEHYTLDAKGAAKLAADREVLAYAYLDEHRFDGVLLTASVLLKNHWPPVDAHRPLVPRERFRCPCRPIDVVLYQDQESWAVETSAEQDEFGTVKTVGDLNRVLSGLGLPLITEVE